MLLNLMIILKFLNYGVFREPEGLFQIIRIIPIKIIIQYIIIILIIIIIIILMENLFLI
jgi:hypothetical protein